MINDSSLIELIQTIYHFLHKTNDYRFFFIQNIQQRSFLKLPLDGVYLKKCLCLFLLNFAVKSRDQVSGVT